VISSSGTGTVRYQESSALLQEKAPPRQPGSSQQVTLLEAELAGAAAREEGGARGGGEARAAEERHGVRRGRHHAGAPASSAAATLIATTASRSGFVLGLSFFPLARSLVAVACEATKVERLLCTYACCPLALCGEGTRGRMLGSDWPGPYLKNPCGWPLIPGTDFEQAPTWRAVYAWLL